jgi:hypothetical protein
VPLKGAAYRPVSMALLAKEVVSKETLLSRLEKSLIAKAQSVPLPVLPSMLAGDDMAEESRRPVSRRRIAIRRDSRGHDRSTE